MSRVAGSSVRPAAVSPARCTLVWLAVSGAATAALVLAAATVRARSRDLVVASAGAPEAAVVLLATVALAGSLLWAWVVATTAVLEAWVHGSVSPGGGVVRRAVLLACGAAVTAGVAGPAVAVDGQTTPTTAAVRIDGLPLPDRATATSRAAHRSRTTPAPPAVVVVGPGDSLWRIAVRLLPDGADPDEVDHLWRQLHAHNRGVIGDDPDLLHPGQRLAVPSPAEGPSPRDQ